MRRPWKKVEKSKRSIDKKRKRGKKKKEGKELRWMKSRREGQHLGLKRFGFVSTF